MTSSCCKSPAPGGRGLTLCKNGPALLPRDNHLELVFLGFAAAGGAAVLLAYVSRIYYENWFLRIKDRIAAAKGDADRGLAVLEG